MNRTIQALDPTIQRYIAQGFLIEHGQKISAADVEQLEMPNAKYYVGVALAANQKSQAVGSGWKSKLRSKRVIFGSVGAGLAVLALFITVLSGGSPEKAVNSSTKSPTTNAMSKVTDLKEATGAVDVMTDDTTTTDVAAPTSPTSTPTPSASSSSTAASERTTAAARAAAKAIADAKAAAEAQAVADAARAKADAERAAAEKAAADEAATHVGDGIEPCTAMITSNCVTPPPQDIPE